MTTNNQLNNKGYNLYNFEHDFKIYLLAGNGNKETAKNYLSDFRFFAGWFNASQSAKNSHPTLAEATTGRDKPEDDKLELFNYLTSQTITDYKKYLVDSHLPDKTINRRLSTVRKFCSFCVTQGWLKENPGKGISNVNGLQSYRVPDLKENKQTSQQANQLTGQGILDLVFEYENNLEAKKLTEKEIKEQMGVVNEFMTVCGLSS